MYKIQIKIIPYFVFLLIFLTSCEMYVTESKRLSLSGKYVINKLEITHTGQPFQKDSTYLGGTIFIDRQNFTSPFDSMKINNFYIHLTESSIRLNLIGSTNEGIDIWEYGNRDNPIFYNTFHTTPYSNGYLKFSFKNKSNEYRTFIFLIEDDGIESLQLKTSGIYVGENNGHKKFMNLYMTRVGP